MTHETVFTLEATPIKFDPGSSAAATRRTESVLNGVAYGEGDLVDLRRLAAATIALATDTQ